ncbi:MAG TPA: IclR family transcriptional regulator [Dehalococcoidia bacterium]|nr:IclR family transcriptional regulator [Dehalococcoidia bacterium]
MDITRRKPSNTTSPVSSLLKAVSILQCFSYDEPELGISDVVRKVERPRTTVHRILSTLLRVGLLIRQNNTGKYRIGPALYTMGSLYLVTTDILAAAEPVTELLNELTGEAIKISVFDRGNVIVIKKEESRHSFRYQHAVGSILPAYASGMGKAFLSELSDIELESLYPSEILKPLTRKTIATKTELKEELKQVRSRGFSVDVEGNTEGLSGVGCVIRDATGKVAAAMSIGVYAHTFTEERMLQLGTLNKIGATLISYRLGYQDPNNVVRSLEEIRAWWKNSQRQKPS